MAESNGAIGRASAPMAADSQAEILRLKGLIRLLQSDLNCLSIELSNRRLVSGRSYQQLGGPSRWEQDIGRIRREVARREEEIARLNALSSSLERQIHELLSSTSWRVTSPIRSLRHAARSRLASGLRRGLRILYWLATFQMARRLEERRLVRRINSSGLFDAAFYTTHYPDLPAGSDPVLHYVVSGAAEGRDPNPAFDTAVYLAAHPEAAAAGSNPLFITWTRNTAPRARRYGLIGPRSSRRRRS